MPSLFNKPCRKVGCSAVTTNRSGYCATHDKGSSWDQYHDGKSSSERGYGAAWRKLRAVVLERDNHLCQMCLADGVVKSGNQCDHIIPKSQGGTDALSNLQCLCLEHHKAKTATERR